MSRRRSRRRSTIAGSQVHLHLGQPRGLPRHPGPKAAEGRRHVINIDVTVIKDGYHGDTSRMYFVGKPRPRRAAGLVDRL
jgi:Xaa-Pro aminopeptidase